MNPGARKPPTLNPRSPRRTTTRERSPEGRVPKSPPDAARYSVGVALSTVSSVIDVKQEEERLGRSIGLDVRRRFCQVAIADGGRTISCAL